MLITKPALIMTSNNDCILNKQLLKKERGRERKKMRERKLNFKVEKILAVPSHSQKCTLCAITASKKNVRYCIVKLYTISF